MGYFASICHGYWYVLLIGNRGGTKRLRQIVLLLTDCGKRCPSVCGNELDMPIAGLVSCT